MMSLCETESEDSVTPQKRKGVRNTFNYKRNIIRNCKVSGEEHINWIGKTVEARKTGNLCRCRKKCFQKLSQAYLDEQLKSFNSFHTKNQQDLYLQGFISTHDIQRRRPRENIENKPKSVSFKYYLELKNNKTEICKTTFISVYGITKGRLYRICKLLAQGKAPRDKRGKKRSGNSIPVEVTIKVHQHIAAYPTKLDNNEKQYLDATLNVKRMYQTFSQKNPDLNVSYNFFLSYFHRNFSLFFEPPQIDSYAVSAELGVKIENCDFKDNDGMFSSEVDGT